MLKTTLTALVIAYSSHTFGLDLPSYIAEVEKQLQLPKNSLRAICTVESNLNPDAINVNDGSVGRHSFGICQVQAPTAELMGFKFKCEEGSVCLLMHPSININIAGLYLQRQLTRYKGDLKKAISSYNAGSWTKKNIAYVNKVMKEML